MIKQTAIKAKNILLLFLNGLFSEYTEHIRSKKNTI
jgi:hypothetical protein